MTIDRDVVLGILGLIAYCAAFRVAYLFVRGED